MASRVRGNVHARFRGGEKAEITSKLYLFLSLMSVAKTLISTAGTAMTKSLTPTTAASTPQSRAAQVMTAFGISKLTALILTAAKVTITLKTTAAAAISTAATETM